MNGIPDQASFRKDEGSDQRRGKCNPSRLESRIVAAQTMRKYACDDERECWVEGIQIPREFCAHESRDEQCNKYPPSDHKSESVVPPPESVPRPYSLPRDRAQTEGNDPGRQPDNLILLKHVQVIQGGASMLFDDPNAASHEVIEK